jgi:hypothetical protein
MFYMWMSEIFFEVLKENFDIDFFSYSSYKQPF